MAMDSNKTLKGVGSPKKILRVVMKLGLAVLSLIVLALSVHGFAHRQGHKSEVEIVRMTPEQRVEEYCREYAGHYVWHEASHSDYTGLLHRYVMKDGLRALPTLTRILAEYDPTTREGRSSKRGSWFDSASDLLLDVDETVARVRASEQGRTAISVMKKAIERMQAADFHTNEDLEYDKEARYKASLRAVQRMEGLSRRDRAIRDTLRIKLKIQMTDDELIGFVSYLIAKDPYYPSGTQTVLYKDFNDLNRAGYPRQFLVLTEIEAFYKAYLEYKAKGK